MEDLFGKFLIVMAAAMSLFICSCGGEGTKTLKQVHVVYRHGARSPRLTYPNDPYQPIAKFWPEGTAQLTDRGIEMQYQLGQFLRKRYDGFINSTYKFDEIYVLSSDFDRTLMSAEANLAGFYPMRALSMNESKEASAVLALQLVPIHSLPSKIDNVLQMKKAPCPRRQAAVDEYTEESRIYERLEEENKEFLRYLGEKSGLNSQGFAIIDPLEDALYSQLTQGFELPSWVNVTLIDKLEELRNGDFKAKYCGTTEIKRLQGGPLAKHMLESMKGHLNESSNKPYKFHMYSGHDDSLASVMSTMGVYDMQLPPRYAAVFIVELHGDDERDYVKLYYRNSTTDPLRELHVPGCGAPCYLEEFAALLKPSIPDDWNRECQRSSTRSLDSDSLVATGNGGITGYILLIAFVAIFALAVSVTVWLSVSHIKYTRGRRVGRTEYRPILRG